MDKQVRIKKLISEKHQKMLDLYFIHDLVYKTGQIRNEVDDINRVIEQRLDGYDDELIENFKEAANHLKFIHRYLCDIQNVTVRSIEENMILVDDK